MKNNGEPWTLDHWSNVYAERKEAKGVWDGTRATLWERQRKIILGGKSLNLDRGK